MYIKLLRHFAGQMTQEELSEKAGITQSSLSRYEANISKMAPDTERKIREAFSDSGLDESMQAVLYEVMNKQKRKGDK
ncbi:helix-turn-helix domain-containing protein [Rossellomorea vietnamensis]|uniref:helix-turn-helix domain-containing protein n=1 Tax=Rossellomorea vietnamensis TaxID=218284 RepID=UPI003D2AC4EE